MRGYFSVHFLRVRNYCLFREFSTDRYYGRKRGGNSYFRKAKVQFMRGKSNTCKRWMDEQQQGISPLTMLELRIWTPPAFSKLYFWSCRQFLIKIFLVGGIISTYSYQYIFISTYSYHVCIIYKLITQTYDIWASLDNLTMPIWATGKTCGNIRVSRCFTEPDEQSCGREKSGTVLTRYTCHHLL